MRRIKLLLPLLAVFLILNLSGCAEKPVPVIAFGDIHTAATSSELYALFSADTEINEDDVERPAISGSVMQEGTNTPVEGFEENDMVKFDGTNLYILDAGDMKIVAPKGENTELLSVTGVWDDGAEDRFETARGLYVSGNTAAVLVDAEVFGDGDSVSTYADQCHIRLYDISNPAAPKLYADFAQDGYLLASRLHEDKVYLVSTDYKIAPDEDEKASFMPIIWDGGEASLMPLDHIFICPTESANAYTVVSVIDLKQAARVDSCAFTGQSSSAIMTNAGLYLARTKNSSTNPLDYKKDGYTILETTESCTTEVKRIQLDGSTLTLTGQAEVDGMLLNPYCMDAYDGTIRLATTANPFNLKRLEDKNGAVRYETHVNDDTAQNSIFTFTDDLTPLGSCTGIVSGQTVYSARFAEKAAYLITYSPEQPFWVVDLSNPKKPALVKNPGVQPSASYLQPVEAGQMFGLGLGEDFLICAELLDSSDPDELEMDTVLNLDYGFSEAMHNPKTLLIDPERQLIGLPADDYYVLLECSGGKLRQKGAVPYEYYSVNTRGVAVGEQVYVCDPQAVTVVDPNGMTVLKTLTFGAG